MRLLNIVALVLGAGLGAQGPELAQQYRQRLAGEVDALGRVAVDFDRSAAAAGLSRAEARRLDAVALAVGEAEAPEVAAWRRGPDAARDAALIVAAGSGAILAELEARLARGAAAKLPLGAKVLIARGYAPGPEIGAALARAEAAWINSGFAAGEAELLALLEAERGAG